MIHTQRHPLRKAAFLCLFTLLLISCQTTTTLKPELPAKQVTPEDILMAEQYEADEAWALAREMYLYLAEGVEQPDRSRYLQKAGLMLYRSGAPQAIEAYYQQLADDDLLPADAIHRDVLLSSVYFDNGKIYQSLGNLPDLETVQQPYYKRLALNLRADGVLAIGKPMESAQLRMQMQDYLQSEEAFNENQERIWDALNRITEPHILRALSDPQSAALRGWLELNLIARRSNMLPDRIDPWIKQWYELYPEHEAATYFAPRLLEESRLIYIKPTRIALLLPLSGKFKSVAEAIQNGFLQAFYDDPQRPELEIVNIGSDGQNFYLQYNQAIHNGADFIVGPLDKKRVNELTLNESLEVPTLTLNYADNDREGINNLYQFGLKPEDEAEQIADYALNNFLYHAVTLTPDNNLGSRLHKAFSERFEALGGQVVDSVQYPSSKNDYSIAIKQLLNLSDSDRRHAILDRVNGQQSEFISRRRQDVDMVFIAGNPRQARLIKPQLKFHHAKDLPVYATSSISSSVSDPDADRDLDEILFVDMPWALDNENNADYQRIRHLWPKQSERYAKFFALGVDAYKLIPSLRRLMINPQESLQLNTGTASVDREGRVHRQLMLATYQKGRARLLQPNIGASGQEP